MKKFLSILLHSILFVLLIHSSSFAETVAVLDFKSLMTDDELGVAVAEILKTELAGLGEYTIIERGMLEQILEEQALQLSGAVDTDTAVKIGKLVGANVVVTGSIVKTGDMYTINSRFIDVETGIVNVGKNIRGQGENQISNMVQQLALILTGNAVVTEEPATTDATTEEPDAKDATQEPETEAKDEPARTEESGNPEKRARDDEGTPSRHDLQQELVEVCLDKQEGAKCRIKGPRGRNFEATCHSVGDQLACFLTRDEASKKLQKRWETLDRNDDGFLDFHEFFGEPPRPGDGPQRGKKPPTGD